MTTADKTDDARFARSADQAREFGAALRETRIAHGRELADAADHLRIRKVYLQAMEDGRFDDLPGPTYAAGFVRAYADYLGLDVNEVVRRFRQATQGITTQSQLVPPSPAVEGRLPTGSVLLVAAVLAVAAYGGWYYLSSEGRNPGEVVAALPDRIAEMVGMNREPDPASPAARPAPSAPPPAASIVSPAPVPERSFPAPFEAAPPAPETQAAPAAAPSDPATPAPVARVPAGSAPAAPMTESPAPPPVPAEGAPASEQVTSVPLPAEPPVAVQPDPPPAAPPTETVPPAAAPETAPEAVALPPAAPETAPRVAAVPPPADRTEGRVVLRATASTWVEIRDGEGRRVFSRLMRAGESYAVPPRSGITLTTGNAGGLDLLVDGRTMPPLGAAGAVRRDVLLDAEALLSQAPSP